MLICLLVPCLCYTQAIATFQTDMPLYKEFKGAKTEEVVTSFLAEKTKPVLQEAVTTKAEFQIMFALLSDIGLARMQTMLRGYKHEVAKKGFIPKELFSS